jgi:hypothetical protein
VVVVPIFAPITTINPWLKERRLALIRATTMAVTPEEDWIRKVVKIPVIKAIALFPVAFSRILFSFSLLALISESRIILRPNKNNVKPPTTANMLKILIPPLFIIMYFGEKILKKEQNCGLFIL